MARKGTLCKALRLPDGSRKWIYAKTEEELEKKLLEAKLQLSMGIDLTNHDTFGEYAQMWYTVYKKPRVSEKTTRSLKSLLNTNILPYLSGYRMQDITPMHIQNLYNKWSGLSEATNRILRSIVSEIFASAEDNNIIIKKPTAAKSLHLGGRRTEKRKAITPSEEQDIISSTSEEAHRSDTASAMNLYLVCVLGLKAGLRIEETLGLQWSDVDFAQNRISVRHSCDGGVIRDTLKTDAAWRTIPLPPTAVEALKYAKGRSISDTVVADRYGKPLKDASSLRRCIHRRFGDNVSPHVLRHTYCTRLFEKGFDLKEVQYLMGHRDVNTTLGVYTHYLKDSRLEDTASKIAEMM